MVSFQETDCDDGSAYHSMFLCHARVLVSITRKNASPTSMAGSNIMLHFCSDCEAGEVHAKTWN